jgi:hypothetical protein
MSRSFVHLQVLDVIIGYGIKTKIKSKIHHLHSSPIKAVVLTMVDPEVFLTLPISSSMSKIIFPTLDP